MTIPRRGGLTVPAPDWPVVPARTQELAGARGERPIYEDTVPGGMIAAGITVLLIVVAMVLADWVVG